MRKTIILIVLVSLLTLTMSGCFGSFSLTRKVYDFNRSVSGEKFVQSLVMWAMFFIPVYEFAGLIDVVLLNLIEFWTGSNPIAMSDTDFEQRIYAHEGKSYEVTTTRNRYDISEIDNPENSFSFVFEVAESAWYLHSQGQSFKITEDSENGLKLFDFEGIVLASF